jgi:hypothetical protein
VPRYAACVAAFAWSARRGSAFTAAIKDGGTGGAGRVRADRDENDRHGADLGALEVE